MTSNLPGEDGDSAIVKTVIANLQQTAPLPVHFKNHLAMDQTMHEPRWTVVVLMPHKAILHMGRD